MGDSDSTRSVAIRRLVAGGALVLVLLAVASAIGLFGGGGTEGAGEGKAARAGSGAVSAASAAAPKPNTGPYRGSVPILMYHVVKAPGPGVAYPELWTPPETFRETISLLASKGYKGVTIAQVWKAWRGGPGLPSKPIVVSFDDGYLSHFATARPILRSVGWPGVLNLEGKNIGSGGLTVPQVKGLIALGWELGAHSMTHPDLPTVSEAQLTEEVAGSRALLRKLFRVPVETFCYPAGKNDQRVQRAVREAGYLTATTVEPGVASPQDNPFALPRIRVNGTDSAPAVLRRVQTGDGVAGSYG
ncbi:MAG: polysaccharide deacetylase family protein [Actinomycetes bacterium]